jgi:hypothetical protein
MGRLGPGHDPLRIARERVVQNLLPQPLATRCTNPRSLPDLTLPSDQFRPAALSSATVRDCQP